MAYNYPEDFYKWGDPPKAPEEDTRDDWAKKQEARIDKYRQGIKQYEKDLKEPVQKEEDKTNIATGISPTNGILDPVDYGYFGFSPV